jgi:hypothetical protein
VNSSTSEAAAGPEPSAAWFEHAEALADLALTRIVVRKDVYGAYKADGGQYTAHEAVTHELLIRHFRGDVTIGVHSTSPDGRCLCLTADIDAHDDQADPDRNWHCAMAVENVLSRYTLKPLVCDSNGRGGYHVREFFKKPVPAKVAWWLGEQINASLVAQGFERIEVFPKQAELTMETPFGNWVRLPGRHHKRPHWTRIWDHTQNVWLEGEAAVHRLIKVAGDDTSALVNAHAEATKDQEHSKNVNRTPPRPGPSTKEDVERARNALSYYPNNNLKYDDWLKIGMSLSELGQGGLALWHEWSKQSTKYDWATTEMKFASFAPGIGVTLGTLFHLAKPNGWTEGPDRRALERNGQPASRVYLLREPGSVAIAEAIGLVTTTLPEHGEPDLKPLTGKEVVVIASPGERWPRKVIFQELAKLKPSPIVKRILLRGPTGRPTTFRDWQEWHDAQSGEDLKREIDQLADTAEAVDEDGQPPFRLRIYGASEFNATTFKQQWLIKNVLVDEQPAGLGSAKKSMKTTITLDAMISLASRTPFLGEFEVPEPVPVLMITGESGGFVTQETVRRICAAKGITPEDLEGRFFIGFELPSFSAEEQMDELARTIWKHQIRVVSLDPTYLCLHNGSSTGKPLDPANLFEMGPLLQEVGRTCLEAGATPLLLHHFKKTTPDPSAPPDLDDFAYSGMAEYMRQWILMRRRERYVPGSGEHKLTLVIGGSAGHAGEWCVDIKEGAVDEKFQGRYWEPKVTFPSEQRAVVEEQAQKREDEKRQVADTKAEKRIGEDAEKMRLAMVRIGVPATRQTIMNETSLNGDRAKKAMAMLVRTGQARLTQVHVKNANGERTCDAYELTGKGPQVD